MNRFRLVRPRTLEEAIAALPDAPLPDRKREARPLAGGQDLLTELAEHLVEPPALVALDGVEGLSGIDVADDGALVIGATTTVAALAEDSRVRRGWTVLAEAARSVGSAQIRSQATVGGNLCQRPRCWYYRNEGAMCLKKGGEECLAWSSGLDRYNAILGGGPSYIVHPSDLAPALVALDATVEIAGPDGERAVPIRRFFTLPSEGDILRENVLAPNELVVRVRVPRPEAGMASTYQKFRERGSYDFALSAVALCLWTEGERIRRARLALGGVAPIPWPCERSEALAAGRPNERATWELVADDCVADADPLEQNGYKVPLTRGLVVRAFQALAEKGESR